MTDVRGETTATIGGVDYPLRLTFAQGVKLEQRLGAGGMSALLTRLMDKVPLSMTELVDVLYAAAVGGGAKITRDDFGQAVWDQGYVSLVPVAVQVVMSAVTSRGPSAPETTEKKG